LNIYYLQQSIVICRQRQERLHTCYYEERKAQMRSGLLKKASAVFLAFAMIFTGLSISQWNIAAWADSADSVSVSVTMNSVSQTMSLSDSDGKTVDVGAPTNEAYKFSVKPGTYTLTGYASDGTTANGTIRLTVSTEASQTYQVWTCTNVKVTNSGWVAGTDYTEALKVTSSDGSDMGAVMGKTDAAGSSGSFLCYNANSASVTFSPTAAHSNYASITKSNTMNNNNGYSFNATIPEACTCTFTVPEGSKVSVGNFSNYYKYTFNDPDGAAVKDAAAGTETYTFKLAKNIQYFYRVSHDGGVTYWDWFTAAEGTAKTVTSSDLYIGSTERTATTADKSLTNVYDVADLYMNVNAKGCLALSQGSTYKFDCYRNWQAIEGFFNSKIAIPDFHYTVIGLDGKASSNVVKVEADASNSASATLTAVGNGTAIVLVTYDAMTDTAGWGSKNFSAIWPENTGAFVVTVGSDGSSINTGMTINAEKNNSVANKLSGSAIDSEIDVLYYNEGTDGAEYTFTPESGTAVTVLRPSYTDGKMTFSGATADGVKTNADGSVTVSKLTEGRNIICVTKNGVSTYQVVTAKKVSATYNYYDASGNETTADKLAAGGSVKITYNRLYIPANKLAGIYNMSGSIYLEDESGNVYKGNTAQYNFASSSSAQTVTVKIPKYYTGSTYSVKGSIFENGFGSPYGSHRYNMYANGRNPQFNAGVRPAYLGNLPKLSFTLGKADFAALKLNIKDKDTGKAVTGAKVTLKDASGSTSSAAEDGSYPVYAGTYDVTVSKAGYMAYTGKITINSDDEAVTKTIKLTAATGGEKSWDGSSMTEPAQKDGVYQIGTGAELAWFANAINKGTISADSKAVLTADIDLADYSWTPIGSDSKTYRGSFDGAGYEIKDLNVKNMSFAGLFGTTAGKISDLTVSGKISTDHGAAGGIAGYLQMDSKGPSITGCVSKVDITYTGTAINYDFGGIAGYAGGTSSTATTISNCVNYGKIDTGAYGIEAGGIIGSNVNGSVSISGCYNAGDITGKTKVGGIVGDAASNSTTVTNCYNTGKITASDTEGNAGAIAGSCSDSHLTVSGAYYLTGTASAAFGSTMAAASADATDSAVLKLTKKTVKASDLDNVKNMLSALLTIPQAGRTSEINADIDLLRSLRNAVSGDEKTVRVEVYDYTAAAHGVTGASKNGTVLDAKVDVDSSMTAADIVKQALTSNGIAYEYATSGGGYFSSINGLGAGTGYSGWCLGYYDASNGSKFDDYSNMGISSITASDGDTIRFDYAYNADTTTDEIGNGWYGLPIVTKYTLGGTTVTMSKATTYDSSYNATTKYYIYNEQSKANTEMKGNGTQADPFIIPVSVSSSTDITAMKANITTSLNSHYATLSDGASEVQNYTSGYEFSLSSIGGTHKSYYKVQVTKAAAPNPGSSTDSDNITVTFRLIGATKSSKAVDYSTGTSDSKYVTWVSTKTYKLAKDSTVYNLFTKAMSDAGLSATGAANNYVSSITAPSSLGGYTLSEMTNGPRSGWMFTVNGKHGNTGLCDTPLKNGDAVIWHYVNDYSYEVSDWSSGSLGTSAIQDLWLKAEDKEPSAADASGTADSSKTVKIDIVPKVTDNTASAAVTDDNIKDLLKQAKDKTADTIDINVKDTASASKTEVILPADSAAEIAASSVSDLKITTEKGKVDLDKKAIKSIADSNAGKAITISMTEASAGSEAQQKVIGAAGRVIEISIKAGDSNISSLGDGKMTADVPVPESLKGKYIEAGIMNEDGTVTKLTGKSVTIGGTDYYEFVSSKTGTFVLADADSVNFEAAPGADNSKIIAGVRATRIVLLKAKVSKGKVVLTWKKSKSGYRLSGYQIARSLSRSGNYKRIATVSIQRYKISKGLKKGTAYYFRVRGYRTVAGQKIFTKWKTVKAIAK